MQGNPNYTTQPLNYDAVATENQMTREWTFVNVQATPLLAMIHQGKTGWRKGYQVKGSSVLCPIAYGDIPEFNAGTAGVSDADEIPDGWPTYDPTEGFTQARYEFTHFRRSMTWKESEATLLSQNVRGNLKEGKTRQLMQKFRTIIGEQIEGASADSRTSLMGIQYAMATANTVGGIPQSTNSWWQSNVAAAAGGAATLGLLNNAHDRILQYTGDSFETMGPDLALLSYYPGGFNVFNKIRTLIDPAQRIVDDALYTKYGVKAYEYIGIKCAQSNRLGSASAGQIAIFTTKTWFWGGMDKPKKHDRIRIPGSDAYEDMYTYWGVLGCKDPRRNFRYTGITS